MLKYIIVLSALISLAIQYGCRCPGEQLYNQKENKCIDVNAHPDLKIEGCTQYKYNQDYTKLECLKCFPSYYYDYRRQTCTKTDVDHCTFFQRYQNSQEQDAQTNMRLLKNENQYTYNCRVCEDGYYLQSYNNCGPNPTENDQGYQANCDRYLTSDKCQYCEKGFYNKEGACIEYPQKECKWYFWNRETKQAQCTRCIHNYYLKENQCLPYPADSKGCGEYAYKDQKSQCLFCDGEDGYVQVNQNDDKCTRIEDSISNCVRGYTSDDKKAICNECQQGYYVNSEQSKCIRNPFSSESAYVKHCKTYYKYSYANGNKLECAECQYGYGLDNNKKCVQGNQVDNCQEYRYDYSSKTVKCSYCRFGYSGYGTYKDKCKQCPYYLGESYAYQLLPGILILVTLFLLLV